MKRRGFLQKLGLGALAVPFVARLEVAEAAEPEYDCDRCRDMGFIVMESGGPRGAIEVDGSKSTSIPLGEQRQYDTAPCPDCTEYADDLLGKLHRAKDEYEVETGRTPEYFVCTTRTRDALAEELREGCFFGTGPEPPLRGGYVALEVHGMRWVRDSGNIQMAYGTFSIDGPITPRYFYDKKTISFGLTDG